VQKQVRETVEAFAKDFGYDLDEEGQPLDADAPLQRRSVSGQDEASEEQPAAAKEMEAQPA
jgi:hypothetical protein